MRHILLTCRLLLIASLQFSCEKEKSIQPEPEIDINDPNLLTNAVTIQNSELVEGSLPEPSTGENTIFIEKEYWNSFTTAQGHEAVIPFWVKLENLAGIYVQIEGADQYFKIHTLNSTPSGTRSNNFYHRMQESSWHGEIKWISIQLPKRLKAGEFCVSYCVFDSNNRISNIEKRCIIVLPTGGRNSAFLTGSATKTWNYVKYQETRDNGYDQEYLVNVPYETDDNNYFKCQTYSDSVKYNETVAVSASLRLSVDGTMVHYSKLTTSVLDSARSQCGNLVFKNEVEEIIEKGSWSYDDDNQMLTLITSQTEGRGESQPYHRELKIVEKSSTNLKLQFSPPNAEQIVNFYYYLEAGE